MLETVTMETQTTQKEKCNNCIILAPELEQNKQTTGLNTGLTFIHVTINPSKSSSTTHPGDITESPFVICHSYLSSHLWHTPDPNNIIVISSITSRSSAKPQTSMSSHGFRFQYLSSSCHFAVNPDH